MKTVILLLALCMCATSCIQPTPRRLTFEEQEAYMARQQCWQEATDMNPEFPGMGNPYWTSYFVMCMRGLGISDAALERMLD